MVDNGRESSVLASTLTIGILFLSILVQLGKMREIRRSANKVFFMGIDMMDSYLIDIPDHLNTCPDI